MSRRIFIAFLISLPFIWYGAFAYAVWIEPSELAPGDNRPGPVWYLPDIGAELQDNLIDSPPNPGINISGIIQTTGNISSTAGKILAPQAKFNINDVSGIIGGNTAPVLAAVNTANNFAVQGLAVSPALDGGGIYGAGYFNPSLAASTGAWAGYFSGYLYADWFCLADGGDGGSDKDCIDSWDDVATAAGVNNLWSLEGGTGPNIYKTDITGKVVIGANAAPVVPTGTRLVLTQDGNNAAQGPRIYIDRTNGNPEISFETTDSSWWGVYTSTTAAVSERDQLRLWQGGADRFAYSNQGAMIFYGWQAASFNTQVVVSGNLGKVSSSPAGITDCRTTSGICTAGFGSGTSLILTATPDSTPSQKYFGHWINGAGDATACNNSPSAICNFTTTAASSITAKFTNLPELKLIVTGGAAGYQIRDNTDLGILCSTGSTCDKEINPTKSFILQTSSVANIVESWTNCPLVQTINGSKACVFSSMGDLSRTVYANFATVTPTAPVFSANSATVSNTAATTNVILSATVADGGSSITARGFCVATTVDPAIGNPGCVSAGSGAGTFGENRGGLTAGTLYHYRAYATNSIGTTYTTDATFTMFNYSLAPSPASGSTSQGSSATTTVTVTKSAGTVAGSVALTASGLPAGASYSYNPTSCTPTTTTCTSVLTLNSGTAAVGGPYTITITGTHGSTTRTTTYTWTITAPVVFDFTIGANPASGTVTQGGSSITTVTVTKTSGVAASVALSVSAGLPSGATANFSPTSCTPTVTTCTSQLTLNSGTAAAGVYTITIRGVSGATSRTTNFSWTIQAPLPGVTLTITTSGSGFVECSVNGGAYGGCSATYPSGTSLELRATGTGFNDFTRWSAATGSATACTNNMFDNPCGPFTLITNSTVNALFSAI